MSSDAIAKHDQPEMLMRIAIFHNLPSGGAKRALYEWTQRLAGSHSIDVFTLSTADHAFCDIRPVVQQHRVFDFTPHRSFESPWGRLNRLQRWRDLGKLTRLDRRIAHEINTGDYDVGFVHTCIYTLIPILVRFLRIPTVYYLHEPFGPTFERQFQRPYLKRNTKWREISKRLDPLVALYNRRLENVRAQSIQQTTLLLANSQFTQRQMKLQYGADAPVCQYGVNTENFRPMPGIRKGNFVTSVGELTPRKGFDFLIESLAHLPFDKRPTLRLVSNWVSPTERLYLEELAAHRNVELQVLTNLNTDQLALEYNRAPLCVYAPVLEPLGLIPLESMACGTPVVGVCEAGVCETILHGETGLLVERDPEKFAAAISSLLEDKELRTRYGKQGRLYVEKEWSWERSTRNVETHLASAAKQRS